MLAMRWQGLMSDSSVIRIICAAWLTAKAITWNLWLSDRLFPVIPVFDFFPSVPPGVHLTLFASSVASIAALLIFPTNRILTASVLFLELLSCSLDQMRWQPWEFHYLLSLAFFLVAKDRKHFIWLIGLSLSATYIFSGLHKFSGAFLYNIWDNIILKRLFGISLETIRHPLIHYSGVSIAIFEVAIGLGLLLTTNKWFVRGAVLIHVAIILALSPMLLNHNVVVIPWNIAFAAMVVICLGKNREKFQVGYLKKGATIAAAAILFALPTLGLFGYWDSYLSFNLYSGNTNELIICTADKRLAPYRTSKYKDCNDYKIAINANKWALNELNVPIYPEIRTFSALKEEWRETHPNDNAVFVSWRYPYGTGNAKEIE